VRILAISDERDPALIPALCREIRPDLVVSCGDLEPAFVDFVASAANATVVFVPGDHDADLRRNRRTLMPAPVSFEDMWGSYDGRDKGRLPGVNLDDKVMAMKGLSVAGLGGSIRYREGPNQYTERQMKRRIRRLERRLLLRRKKLDLLVAHSPPDQAGSEAEGPNRGFVCFERLIADLQPSLMLHGHVHPGAFAEADRNLGRTRVVNVIPHRVIEI
jgi:hypothetical protein